MIRHIVFDMGEVVENFSDGLFTERLHLNEEDAVLIRREVLQTTEWIRLDRGTISLDDALVQMQARLPHRLHGMAELARDLKEAGYDLYLLSNAASRHADYWHDIPGSRYFSGTFISADYHLLKPEDAIYQAFFRKFGLKPAECLFIDDSPANIEASQNAGMDGIVFHGDAAHLRRQLEARHIL